MIVAGGSYLEVCLRPEWRRLFGSGLRAAAAVANLSPGTVLHTYGFTDWTKDIIHSAQAFGAAATIRPIAEAISFSYIHPLSASRLHPRTPHQQAPLEVDGSVVLRFGFVEGDAVVRAEHAVYDPQTGAAPAAFGANGSRAAHVAVVLNEEEAALESAAAGRADPSQLIGFHGAEVIVVKRGPRGATVYERSGARADVPAYRSAKVFKIGSGDVFSAAFTHYWGEKRLDPAVAADLASRSVANFVDSHALPLAAASSSGPEIPVDGSRLRGRIYLAGPFFDLAQRWLVEEAHRTLLALGAEVFSPLHEVGTGLPRVELAAADIAGLRGCSTVLALLDGMDPGTVYEVGYARALGLPVVALAERTDAESLTMIAGSDCEIVDDFTSAVYRAIWAASR
ncbi:nucleoside 2-deoxyribosyltransferase [Pseudorhodoplanes sp.]|uniref:nucleoside 2-deoxyribosyltransferase n=1 Tax=Pseudorhodoplanes sp. TaxID=1934341 RepID=UPI003D12AFF5